MNYCLIVDESPLCVSVCVCVCYDRQIVLKFSSASLCISVRGNGGLSTFSVSVLPLYIPWVFWKCYLSLCWYTQEQALEMLTVSVRFIDRQIKIQTKQFDVLPSELQQSWKYISCDSFNETICIQATSDCSSFRKWKKNDCTTRIRQNPFDSTLENTCTGLDLHIKVLKLQCLVIQMPLEFEIERDCAFLMEVMLKNRSCPHRLHPVITWQLGTNYIFRHPTTGTVPPTTENWRIATKLRITSLTMNRNMTNFLILLLFVFFNVRHHKMLIIDFNTAICTVWTHFGHVEFHWLAWNWLALN